MKTIFSISCLFICIAYANAQTKIIAFKSHSGTAADFAAEFHGHFELLICNLGDPGINWNQQGMIDLYDTKHLSEVEVRSSKNKRLDTVRWVNDTMVVFSTAELKKNENTGKLKWVEKKDTILHNQNLSNKNSVNHVKGYIKSSFFYKNTVESVTFIGYAKTSQNTAPFVPYSKPPGGDQPFVILVLLSILAIAGFFSWRTFKTFQPG
ncbi:MAG TPA: hypothetical protein VK177_14105 [Flavobacteriales bacterium]|nr:hypothetical protein [Flavobacteriales bacterium]